MRSLQRFIIIAIALAGTLACGAEDPAIKLRSTIDAALDALYGDCCANQSDAEKRAAVREVLESSYDFTVIIRYATGTNWKRMQDDEQERFVSLIKELVLKTYVEGLDGKERPELQYGKTKLAGKRSEVPMVVSLDGKDYRAVYRFAMRQTGWEIYDIVVEDISIGKNYREQFNDHFRKGTAAELLEKLEKLLEEENLDEKIAL